MPYRVRHRLVHVRQQALARLAEEATTEHARNGLAHWAKHHLPLVVTRQPPDLAPHLLRIGLPLPLQWGRLRLSLTLPRADVLVHTPFPSLAEVSRSQALGLQALVDALQAPGLQAQVYGSHGWQTLTGLAYVHEASDLDVLIRVHNEHQAGLATEALLASADTSTRLDGELMFPDGSAVAWREWAAWRAGETPRYLVKTLLGAQLASGTTPHQASGVH